MIQITWRYDPNEDPIAADPATAEEVRFLLQRGNRAFADLGRGGDRAEYVIPVSAQELGFSEVPGVAPVQTPMVAVLGCADARVPLELVFSQSANEMFTVRVAGNVLDGACVGSIDFAITQLSSVRLVAVVGHTGCGAVRSAVDAFLDPSAYLRLSANLPLRGIIDSLMAAVSGADDALRTTYGHERSQRPGYYEALQACAVVLNAAVAGDAVRRMFGVHLGEQLDVSFGVYDLMTRLVGLPSGEAWRAGLFVPPDPDEMGAFLGELVRSAYVERLLLGG